jgi:hypothetical protein
MNMKNKIDNYLGNLLPLNLMTYQFVEEGLKTCLRYHHLIIHQNLKGVFPYTPSVESPLIMLQWVD